MSNFEWEPQEKAFPMLGLFGGTFDPIHNGHLSVANGLLSRLPLEHIQLIPCKYSLEKKPPKAAVSDRLAMIKLAITDQPCLAINTLELERKSISYTIETLQVYRELFPNTSLCLILATDVFSYLNQWREWNNLLYYCHFIIAERPQFSLSQEPWLVDLCEQNKTEEPRDLALTLSGKILFQQPTQSKITATEIRRFLAVGNYGAVASMLPKTVLDYIRIHKCYLI